jgi:hypothetical protein
MSLLKKWIDAAYHKVFGHAEGGSTTLTKSEPQEIKPFVAPQKAAAKLPQVTSPSRERY